MMSGFITLQDAAEVLAEYSGTEDASFWLVVLEQSATELRAVKQWVEHRGALPGGVSCLHPPEEWRIPLPMFDVWCKSNQFVPRLPDTESTSPKRQRLNAIETAPAEEQQAPKLRAQEEAIIKTLAALGFAPKALPPNEPGRPGVKAACKKALSENQLFDGATTFNKAWERLTGFGDIEYSK